ncbi:hypothetical protein [Thermococcus stetteri]|uniref:hypothetical protein n=1 Tax=Thermococcus stetteri TaxID=49900 RepID=UPI001AE2091C|nr:hypothetical protein [Thermococcus stetteri]
MQIVEIDMKLPYKERGAILSKIVSKLGGRIRDIHFHPPDPTGIGEVRMEIEVENGRSVISELKRLLKGGRFSFMILSEA